LGKESSEKLHLGNDLGHGFFQIICVDEVATQKILMRTPYLSKWGTSIIQPWMPEFNSRKPVGLKMPIWVMLKTVPDLFRSSAIDLAKSLGPVVGKHRGNATNIDQKFCVALTAGAPFPITVGATNPIIGKISHINVDYNNLPIRCRQCLSTSHLIRKCPLIIGKEVDSEPEGEGKDRASERTIERDQEKDGNQDQAQQKNALATNQHAGEADTTKRTNVAASQDKPRQYQDKGKGPETTHRGGRGKGHASQVTVAPCIGSSASSASTDAEGNKEKRPNPSFRGVQKEGGRTPIRSGPGT
jgi:hypothetical protein